MVDDLVGSLATGLSAIGVLYFILYRFTALRASQVSLLLILLVFAIYIPYAIFNWPGGDVFSIHLALFVTLPYGSGIIVSSREKYLATFGKDQKKQWFHWGPALIIAFFGGVVALNAVFVTLAHHGLESAVAKALLPESKGNTVTSFFPGVVSHDFHEKESQFNVYMQEHKQQTKQGWQVKKGWLFEPMAGISNSFQVGISDRDNVAISAAEVIVRFYRPSDQRLDQKFILPETEKGIYRSAIKLDQPGTWRVVIHIKQGEKLHEIRAMTSLQSAGDA
ncbi:MAG: FixH family protein [Gammaproteobacteria bacterium]|nr:FixH family protein [Gammaproteobacteria bacterium]